MTSATTSLLITAQGSQGDVNIETFESRLHSEMALVPEYRGIVDVNHHASDFMANGAF